MAIPTLVTFIVYFVVLLGVGFYFYRKNVSIEDYLLGGRGMGAWVTALSAQVSDMSGWLLHVVSAIVILIFFTIYASAQLVGAGKLFESTFNVRYETAVVVGGVIIVAYTFLGGFLAVCWTDLFQGALMLVAIIIVPAAGYIDVGGIGAIEEAIEAEDVWASNSIYYFLLTIDYFDLGKFVAIFGIVG